jgi:hypothetical protein
MVILRLREAHINHARVKGIRNEQYVYQKVAGAGIAGSGDSDRCQLIYGFPEEQPAGCLEFTDIRTTGAGIGAEREGGFPIFGCQ